MKTSIIKIGNSKGVRIPKILLDESGLNGDVDLKVVKGEIRISAAKKNPKKPIVFNEEYLLSRSALAKEWDTPDEDVAWNHLQ